MVITVTRRHLVWALIVLALIVPRVAFSTGTLAIPNTIAAQSGPTLAASLLDTNWTTIASYVNAREVTINTLAARPAAGTSGRWYFASDDNQGTLYADTGSAWMQVAAAVGSGTNAYAVRGLLAATATGTNSQINVIADLVVLRNPSTGAVVARTATATLTNNMLTAGPVANGRDRAASIAAQSFAHLYYIWDGSTLATLISPCQPTDVTGCSSVGGPVLPSGYSFWAYIGAMRINASGTMMPIRFRGAWALYDNPGIDGRALSGGTSLTEATISGVNGGFIAGNSTAYQVRVGLLGAFGTGGAALDALVLRTVPGLDYQSTHATSTAAGAATSQGDLVFVAPNTGALYYQISRSSVGGTAPAAFVDIDGYRMPNGGE